MWNLHKHESPKTVRQNKVYMSFWTEEESVGVWGFEEKEGNS